MKLTKERRIYGAVLGLALAAIGADRVLLGPGPAGPATAAAGPAAAGILPGPPETAPGARGEILADRLRALEGSWGIDVEGVDDVFRASDGWPTDVAVEEVEGMPEEVEVRLEPVAFKLTAVMSRPSGGWVIVNGELLRPGQGLRGWTLVEVKESAATFKSEGREIQVSMDGPERGSRHHAEPTLAGEGSGESPDVGELGGPE